MNLVERVQAILLKPKDTWPVIEGESTTVKDIFTGYVMILAAIPAVCGFVGMSLVGYSMFGMTVRVPFLAGIGNMIVGYVLSLVMVYVMALIADALAPTFEGQKNQINAVKLVAFSMTAGMLGGVFSLLPMLSILGILASLYSIYLLYTGIPVMMKAPESKAIGYTVVLVICGIVAAVVVGAVSSIFGMGSMGAAHMGRVDSDDAHVSIKVPGTEINIDTAKIEEASKKMEEASKRMEEAQAKGDGAAAGKALGDMMAAATGGAKTIPVDKIQAFVPEKLAGMERESIETSSGQGGMQFTSVDAGYAKPDGGSLHVQVQDIGAVQFLRMAAAAWASTTVNRETKEEVEKIYQKDGIAYKESYQKDGSSAEMSMLLPNGILVDINGNQLSIDQVREAIGALDLSAMGALSRPE